jgi:hypothetical protein
MLPRILFLDACVLYPTQTRDLFMRLALEGLVRLKWSQRVQEEWIRNSFVCYLTPTPRV